jgi:hypothetical protein
MRGSINSNTDISGGLNYQISLDRDSDCVDKGSD